MLFCGAGKFRGARNVDGDTCRRTCSECWPVVILWCWQVMLIVHRWRVCRYFGVRADNMLTDDALRSAVCGEGGAIMIFSSCRKVPADVDVSSFCCTSTDNAGDTW